MELIRRQPGSIRFWSNTIRVFFVLERNRHRSRNVDAIEIYRYHRVVLRTLGLVLALSLFTSTSVAGCPQFFSELFDFITARHGGNPVVYFPEKTGTENFLRIGNGGFVHEAGVIQVGRNQLLNGTIKELESAGGEVRSVQTLVSLTLIPRNSGDSYFRVSANGAPILAIERGSSNATILHELAHFRDWLGFRNDFLADGFDKKVAGLKAKAKLASSPSMTQWTESNAVRAEQALTRSDVTDSHFLRRSVYPEIAAVLKANSKKKKLSARRKHELDAMLDTAIEKAIAIRRLRLTYFQDELAKETPNSRQADILQGNIAAAADFNTLSKELFPETKWDEIAKEQGLVLDLSFQQRFEERLRRFLLRSQSGRE